MRLPPLPEPPRAGARAPFPVVAVVAPVVGAVVIGLVVGSPFMLMFAALGPVIAIASLLDARRAGRRHLRGERERFDRECQLFEVEIDRAHQAEREAADARHPVIDLGDRERRALAPLRVGSATGPSAIAPDMSRPYGESDDDERRRRMLARAAINPQLPALIDRGPIVLVGEGLAADVLARRWSQEPGVSVERRGAEDTTLSDVAVVTVRSATAVDVWVPGAGVRRVRPEFSSERQVQAMESTAGGSAELPVSLAWSALEAMPRDGADSAGVAVGVGATGAVAIDLVSSGPHAIVGGTTGSGKSEFLRALALGWAAAAPPSRAQLLFVDFKGGATFAGLTELPHTAGLVTDLDPIVAQRAVRALRAELQHRERSLADADVRDLRDRPELLPRLLVLVDEYAALIETFPDVHAVFSDLASRGRSLGVHLVLCTQHPSGIVRDAIAANCPVRISFRVTEPSAAAIVGDLARDLVAAPPGRAAVVDERGGRAVQVAVISDDDIRSVREQWSGHDPAGSTWCAPLPELVTADDVAELADQQLDGASRQSSSVISMIDFGMVDDPDNRCRRVARWAPPRDGSLAIQGASHSGRTTLLAALAEQVTDRASVVVLPSGLSAAWAVLERLSRGNSAPTLLLADDLDQIVSGAGERSGELLALWDSAVRSVRAAGGAAAAAFTVSTPGAATLLARFESRVLLRCSDADEHALVGAPRGLFDRRSPAGRGWWHERQMHTLMPTSSLPSPADGRATEWKPSHSTDLIVVTNHVTDISALIAAHYSAYRWVDDVRLLDAQSFGSADSVALVPRVAIATPEAWQTAWGVLSAARQSAPVVLTRVDAADVRALLGCRDPLAPLDVQAGECWVAEPGAPPVRARWQALSTS